MVPDCEDRRDEVGTALEQAFEPLVELMLDLGLTSSNAEDLLRNVFVRTAHRKLAAQMERVPISLVALQCGLYRQDVRKRLKAAPPKSPKDSPGTHRLNQLITAWHEDPDFTTKDGQPRVLPYKGNVSFTTLVSRYTAYMYPALVLRELERAAVVVKAAGRRLKIVEREYAGRDLGGLRLSEFGQNAKHVLSALVAPVRQPRAASMTMTALGFEIDPEVQSALNEAIRERGKTFLRLVEGDLKAAPRTAPGTGVRIGVLLTPLAFQEVGPAADETESLSGRGQKKRRSS